jgi:hypothetical protein
MREFTSAKSANPSSLGSKPNGSITTPCTSKNMGTTDAMSSLTSPFASSAAAWWKQDLLA